MHYFERVGSTGTVTWMVFAKLSDDKSSFVREFDTECEAACFTAWLNGGAAPRGLLARLGWNYDAQM